MDRIKDFHLNRHLLMTLAYGTVLLALLLNINSGHTQPRLITYYVGIDFENETGYVYDQNFALQPTLADDPKSGMVILPDNSPMWYLANDVDIVRRNDDDSIDILSADPAYSEMVHHMVWGYTAPKRSRTFECDIELLIPVGSELSSFHFPRGYGYKLDSGVLVAIWDWKNPANKTANEKIYLRFNITVDDAVSGYRDTNLDWINKVPCTSEFELPPGKSKVTTQKFPVVSDRRIIAVLPHIHDHGGEIKLKSDHATVREFEPEFQNFPVMHYDMGDGPVLLHSNKKHLPVNGLSAWTPGVFGPIIKAGDSLWLESKFNNPHSVAIDNMLIAFVFWEAINK